MGRVARSLTHGRDIGIPERQRRWVSRLQHFSQLTYGSVVTAAEGHTRALSHTEALLWAFTPASTLAVKSHNSPVATTVVTSVL